MNILVNPVDMFPQIRTVIVRVDTKLAFELLHFAAFNRYVSVQISQKYMI